MVTVAKNENKNFNEIKNSLWPEKRKKNGDLNLILVYGAFKCLIILFQKIED